MYLLYNIKWKKEQVIEQYLLQDRILKKKKKTRKVPVHYSVETSG